MERILGDEKLNVDFVEACFTIRMDFIIIRNFVINNGLRCYNQFHYHGKVAKVNRM
jgi:hypothetical protein